MVEIHNTKVRTVNNDHCRTKSKLNCKKQVVPLSSINYNQDKVHLEQRASISFAQSQNRLDDRSKAEANSSSENDVQKIVNVAPHEISCSSFQVREGTPLEIYEKTQANCSIFYIKLLELVITSTE